ncbi:biotin--[acetyl-CoA-carboxylase] ligase [uncultured Enterovirga sp.]|uniref:biotin--[acetyl-CoA-carboxylase] ligase n=1 Tax=uncultured Enterovirga sp. TaxID=2026352 RepID=UPI0035CC139B
MAFALSDRAQAAGYRLAAFRTIGSTSQEAVGRARDGDPGPLWVVAEHQSAGQGRRGSAWHTPRGNLAASLLLTTDLSPATLATLGFAAGVALAKALDACAREDMASFKARTPFRLKWPNDVLVDGAKLAGILLGTEELGGGRRAVVLGIGVNVAAAPEGLPYPATSLHALGCATDAERLFTALSASWLEVEGVWDGGRGFAEIREAWLARAAGLGGAVAVRTGGDARRGTFETIDGQGQLVLRSPDGAIHRVSAGEVHFGAAASATPEARV